MDDPVTRTLQSLPDRPALIGGLRDAAVRIREAEIDQLVLIAACAEAYSWVDDDADAQVLHGERLVSLGADGTPEIAEFLTLEVGPALGISPGAAAQQVADVLNLQHRHPDLWAHVIAGHVRFASARRVAQIVASRGLSRTRARELDRRLAPWAPGWGTTRLVNEAERLCAVIDPEGEQHRRRAALDARFVHTQPGEGGVIELAARLDGGAGLRLEATITELAGILTRNPDPLLDPHQQAGLIDMPAERERNARARALELLAAPARAAAVLAAGRGGGAAHRAALQLEVRVRPDDIERGAGGEITGLGPAARSQLDQLLAGASQVVVRPVVDLNVDHVTSGYQPTNAQRRTVLTRDHCVTFPYATRRSTSRGVDLDHVIPWPGGATGTHNLIPLDRRTHRAKTHGGFRVERVRPGVVKWTTPAGQTYWVSPHGTFADDPAIERTLDPVGVRRRTRAATREAARRARESERHRLRQEASDVAARLLARAPELIPLAPGLHLPDPSDQEVHAA